VSEPNNPYQSQARRAPTRRALTFHAIAGTANRFAAVVNTGLKRFLLELHQIENPQ
jgi:hypothetical protein